MDLIQKVAIMTLLTLVLYFLLVNVIDKYSVKSLPTVGRVGSVGSVGTVGTIVNHIESTPNAVPTSDGPQGPQGQLSVYNEKTTGIVPSNHSKFETPADFGSDKTNINKFYQNNPEIFNKTIAYVPDPDSWDDQSKKIDAEMQFKMQEKVPLNGYNYEDAFQHIAF